MEVGLVKKVLKCPGCLQTLAECLHGRDANPHNVAVGQTVVLGDRFENNTNANMEFSEQGSKGTILKLYSLANRLDVLWQTPSSSSPSDTSFPPAFYPAGKSQ